MTTRVINTNRHSVHHWSVVVTVLGACLLGALRTEAQVTNVIWRATFSGMLGIQSIGQNLVPQQQTAKLKTSDLLGLVGASTATEVLALNIEAGSTGTNIFLSVFDTSSRENIRRITTGETTTLFQDGANAVFDVDAPIPFLTPQLLGGRLRISGRAKIVSGVPSALRANVSGFLVDVRPGDLGGTTGLVMRATLKTSGAPLRVLPASGH
jgi:hypothetical protein